MIWYHAAVMMMMWWVMQDDNPEIMTNCKKLKDQIFVEPPPCAPVQSLSVNTKDQTSGERRQKNGYLSCGGNMKHFS